MASVQPSVAAATALVFALAALTPRAALAAPLTWTRLEPADPTAPQPPPRHGGALVHDALTARLVLFGGIGASSLLNDVWAFHLANRSWAQLPQQPGAPAPEPRHTFVYDIFINASTAGRAAAAPPGRALLVATGQGAAAVLSDVWALDLDSGGWRRLPDAGDAPAKRYGSAGGIAPQSLSGGPAGSRLWLSHGFSSSVRFSDTRYYDLLEERWQLTHGSINSYSPSGPHARCIVSSAVTPLPAEQLLLFGGCAQNGGTGGPCPARDAWRYEAGRSRWHELSRCPSPRTRGALLPLASPAGDPYGGSRSAGGRFVLLYGGYERGAQTISVSEAPDEQLPVLDLEGGRWRMLRAGGEVPQFRGQPAAAHDVPGGRAFIFGGQMRSGGGLLNDLYVLQGDPEDTPRGGGSTGRCGDTFLYPYLHGIFMFLAWGVLLQAGWFIARYFKSHDPAWFHAHRVCQVLGLLCAFVGLAVVLAGGVKGRNLVFSHGVIGLVAIGLAFLQPFNAFLRPHKGERWRVQWEWLHLSTGRAALLLGTANVSLGTFLVQGPAAVWISWHVLLFVFLVVVAVVEVRHQRGLRRARQAEAKGGGKGGGEGEAAEEGGAAGVGGKAEGLQLRAELGPSAAGGGVVHRG